MHASGDEFLEHISASFLAPSHRVYFFGEIRCVIKCAQVVIHHSWRSSLQMLCLVNQNAVTSRGPETTIEFALALVERLYGKEKMEEVDGPLVRCKS